MILSLQANSTGSQSLVELHRYGIISGLQAAKKARTEYCEDKLCEESLCKNQASQVTHIIPTTDKLKG